MLPGLLTVGAWIRAALCSGYPLRDAIPVRSLLKQGVYEYEYTSPEIQTREILALRFARTDQWYTGLVYYSDGILSTDRLLTWTQTLSKVGFCHELIEYLMNATSLDNQCVYPAVTGHSLAKLLQKKCTRH